MSALIDELVTAECSRGFIKIERRGAWAGGPDALWIYRVLTLSELRVTGFWCNSGEGSWQQRNDSEAITAYERRSIVEQALAQIKRRAEPPRPINEILRPMPANPMHHPHAPSGNRGVRTDFDRKR